MKIPRGFEIEGAAKGEYLLHIKCNIYGQVQAGRVWNKYLVGKLTDIGFKQSMVDKSVIFCGNVIYALYMDDSILASPDDDELDKVICDMQSTGLELTEEGNLSDFLGVNIDRRADGTVHLMQPQLLIKFCTNCNWREKMSQQNRRPQWLAKFLRETFMENVTMTPFIIVQSLEDSTIWKSVQDWTFLVLCINACAFQLTPSGHMQMRSDGLEDTFLLQETKG